MPRNKEQNEEIRRGRKEAIIQGALKVYVEKGYAAAEIRDVAQRAGVARGLIHYYFKDKLELFRELFNFMFDQSRRRVQSHFAENGLVSKMLEDFVRSMCSNMLEQSEGVLFFMRMRHDLHELFTPDELKNWSFHLDNLKLIRDTLERGMESGQIRQMSPQLLASQYWGAVMHGMMYLRQANQELQEQGMNKTEIAETIKRDMEDAVACCMSLVTPPLPENLSGDGET